MDTKTIMKMEDSKLFYKKTYPIKYYEMDFNQVLKPSALMNLLQDMATIHAEMMGFGSSFVFPRNYAWFLIKYHMEFDEYPCALDDIVIKTEPRGVLKILANRDFEIWTTDNRRLGRVASSWMMIDLSTKSFVSLSKTFPDEYFAKPLEKRESDLQFEKIKPLEQIDYEKTFSIGFDDIDVNRHVNNANYLVWAFEALPYEFRIKNRLKTLDIVFKKEIAYGHEIISAAELNLENKTSMHVLKNAVNGEELCMVRATWIN